MCDVTRDLQTPPLLQTTTFSQTPPYPWSVKYFMYTVRPLTIYDPPFSDSEALRPNYSAHADCYSPIQELCLCWTLRLDTPCTWLELLSLSPTQPQR